MRSIVLAIPLLFTLITRSQVVLTGPINIYSGPEIKNEEIWITGIMGSANVFVSAINIKQFRKIHKKSNAGFLLFPGLVQLGIGALYKTGSDPTKNTDVAIGAASVFICAARMIYRPKKKKGEAAFLMPYYIPGKKAFAAGLSFKYKI